MDDEDVLIISSSPEPEQEPVTHSNKGKGRATNDDSEDLALDSDGTDLDVSGADLDPPKANARGMMDAHNSDGRYGTSTDTLPPVASGSGVTIDVQVLADPVEATIKQVLDVIPNVELEHLRSLVHSYQSQGHEDVSVSGTARLDNSHCSS
jgi:hypothetical protein